MTTEDGQHRHAASHSSPLSVFGPRPPTPWLALALPVGLLRHFLGEEGEAEASYDRACSPAQAFDRHFEEASYVNVAHAPEPASLERRPVQLTEAPPPGES